MNNKVAYLGIYYFSILMIAGVITGVVIGIIAREMIKRIK